MWRATTCSALFALLALAALGAHAQVPDPFDVTIFPTVIPGIVPFLLKFENPVIIRSISIIDAVFWDAWAAFHPTAATTFGLCTPRAPPANQTLRNRNIAIAGALKRYLTEEFPEALSSPQLSVLTDLNIDDPTSCARFEPACIGGQAAARVLAATRDDGWNSQATRGGPDYSDYTNYSPVNTAYGIRDPKRWAPLVAPGDFIGSFQVQSHVTPQAGHARPLAVPQATVAARRARIAAPYRRLAGARLRRVFSQQANELIAATRNLTERQKLLAEYFDNKILHLAIDPFIQLVQSTDDFVKLDWVHLGVHDGALVAWHGKRYVADAIRPVSLIQNVLGIKTWVPWLLAPPHSEYPASTACYCVAFAEFLAAFKGTKAVTLTHTFPAGSSQVAPGAVPAAELTVTWTNLDDWARDCANSRIWAGVNFPAAVRDAQKLCRGFGVLAYQRMQSRLTGEGCRR